MRDAHWGSSSLTWPLLAVLGILGVGVSLIGLFAWSPWKEPTEVEWLAEYRAWSDEIEGSLGAGLVFSRAMCESRFDEEVGEPPHDSLRPAAAAARGACAAPTRARWREGRADVVRALIDEHDELQPPRRRRDLGAIVRDGVGVQPDVYCWQPAAWTSFFELYAIVRGGVEASLEGIADGRRNRIDLGPAVCSALAWYQRRERPTALSYENFELADALAVLTHQAEHLKAPSAAEADIECFAVQHVRPLVRAAGWGPEYAAELALQVWELSYLRLPPELRSPACRDGGSLDRHPRSAAWP